LSGAVEAASAGPEEGATWAVGLAIGALTVVGDGGAVIVGVGVPAAGAAELCAVEAGAVVGVDAAAAAEDSSGDAAAGAEVAAAGEGGSVDALVVGVTAGLAMGNAAGEVSGEAVGPAEVAKGAAQDAACVLVSSPLPKMLASMAAATLEIEMTIASATARARVSVPSFGSLTKLAGSRRICFRFASFVMRLSSLRLAGGRSVDRPPALSFATSYRAKREVHHAVENPFVWLDETSESWSASWSMSESASAS
jgi:hypothetical protein